MNPPTSISVSLITPLWFIYLFTHTPPLSPHPHPDAKPRRTSYLAEISASKAS